MQWTKKARAKYFNKQIEKQGYKEWGKAQRLAEELQVSHSMVSNWLGGALPRQHSEIKRVSDHLGLDLMHWVYGETSTELRLDAARLSQSILTAKSLEAQIEGRCLSAEEFTQLVVLDYTGEIAGKATLKALRLIEGLRSGSEDQ